MTLHNFISKYVYRYADSIRNEVNNPNGNLELLLYRTIKTFHEEFQPYNKEHSYNMALKHIREYIEELEG